MALTLADALRQTGYAQDGQLQAPAPTQPNLSTMAGNYFAQLPEKTAQNAINTNNIVQNAMPYNFEAHQFEKGPTFSEFANYVPNLMGSTNAIKTAKALLSAEKQAALPVSEGGLGLAKNNTPAERAAAQGYIDYYHGTERLDRLLEGKTLDPKRATSGPMPYGTASNQMASSYATGKKDTSRIANDMGEMANYFQVSPKDLGYTRQKTPYTVEQTWHHLSPEKKAEILNKAQRVGFENLDDAINFKFSFVKDVK